MNHLAVGLEGRDHGAVDNGNDVGLKSYLEEGEGVEPEIPEGVDPEASISFVGEVCSRAAMVGVEVARTSMQSRRGVAVTTARVSGASRRWLRALFEIGIRVCRWVCGSRRTSCFEPPAPTSIYSVVRRGPTNHVGLGAPDQGARPRPNRPLVLLVRRSI